LSCHDPHRSDFAKLLVAPKPDLCFRCHGDTDFKGAIKHAPLVTSGCSACHDTHASASPKLLKVGCTDCHPQYHSGTTVEPVRLDPEKSGPVYEECVGCHNPHSSDFGKLFRERKTPPSDTEQGFLDDEFQQEESTDESI